MATTKLIALERFYYAGQNVEQGEAFDAEEVDVSLLTHSVSPRAKLAEAEPKRAAAKEPDEPSAKPQAYKRRDMKAER